MLIAPDGILRFIDLPEDPDAHLPVIAELIGAAPDADGRNPGMFRYPAIDPVMATLGISVWQAGEPQGQEINEYASRLLGSVGVWGPVVITQHGVPERTPGGAFNPTEYLMEIDAGTTAQHIGRVLEAHTGYGPPMSVVDALACTHSGNWNMDGYMEIDMTKWQAAAAAVEADQPVADPLNADTAKREMELMSVQREDLDDVRARAVESLHILPAAVAIQNDDSGEWETTPMIMLTLALQGGDETFYLAPDINVLGAFSIRLLECATVAIAQAQLTEDPTTVNGQAFAMAADEIGKAEQADSEE